MWDQGKWLGAVWHLDVTRGTRRSPDELRQENRMVRYGP